MVNIVLFGPPGSGKGTQAAKLVNEFNFFKISTGDLLRQEIDKENQLSIEIKSTIDKGLLVQDDIINNLIEKILSNKSYFNRLIFDGYPRNLRQARNLDFLIKKYDQKISYVLSLKIDQKVIIKRILGRQICSNCGQIFNTFFSPATKENHKCDLKFLQKRSDDNEHTITNRFETYIMETLPILDYYQKQNLLHQIDGMREIPVIYKEICQIVQLLETWLYNVYLYK